MVIDWINDMPLPEDMLSLMRAAADSAPACEGIGFPCAVSVRLCSDEDIAVINEQCRGISRSTDVLSFPAVSWPAGKTAGSCPALLRREFDDELGACFLGDIVIAVPHIYTQAKEYGHSASREAAYLLVHGLCHLMGYDHIRKEDQIVMRAMEEKILSSVSAVRGPELSGADRELLDAAREAMKFSYSPYSHFPVGAALRAADGRIFTGCNVENISFGLTNCAERTALFKAVSEGARAFTDIAIAANSAPWPCGACRQALQEFAPDLRILMTWEDQVIESSLTRLLPGSIELNEKEPEPSHD